MQKTKYKKETLTAIFGYKGYLCFKNRCFFVLLQKNYRYCLTLFKM